MNVTLALIMMIAAADPAPLMAGAAAPFSGVLLPPERLEELIRAEVERDALRERLATEIEVRKAWAAIAAQAVATPPLAPAMFDNPSLNFWVGVSIGVVGGVGAVVAGAWITGVAGDVSGATP